MQGLGQGLVPKGLAFCESGCFPSCPPKISDLALVRKPGNIALKQGSRNPKLKVTSLRAKLKVFDYKEPEDHRD